MKNLLKAFGLVLVLVSFTKIRVTEVEASYIPTRGPAGMVFAFAGTVCPAHSAAANGASQLRAGTYANLFTAISTNYGTADGTHFNLPDLRGKFARGVDGTATNDPDHSTRTACNTGGNTGNNVGSCEVDDFKAHTHLEGIGGVQGSCVGNCYNNTGGSSFVSSASGSAGGTETRPLNVYVLYCIWY